MNSPFRVAVINDEITQDFERACAIAAGAFGMEWIELRAMWNKNVLNLDSKEVADARRILEKYKLRVTDIASPLFKVDWPGVPPSKFSPQGAQFGADFTFGQQDEVFERGIELAKVFETDRVRCFDFWRLVDSAPYRTAINQKLLDAASKAGKNGITLTLEKRDGVQHGNRSGSGESPGGGEVAVFHAQLGPRQRSHARRNSVSQGIRSVAEGSHRTLPLQRRRQKTGRQLFHCAIAAQDALA
jgi:hypothetical protein